MSDFRQQMVESFLYHIDSCPPFAALCDRFDPDMALEELPFIPARLFKRLDLCSVPADQIVRWVESSGTSGKPSRVALDRSTLMAQQRHLLSQLADLLGNRRLPFWLFADPEMGEGGTLTARSAAMRGFLLAASSVTTLDERLPPTSEPAVVLGYTHQFWNQLPRCDLSQATLIHFGGWKRLKGVSRADFLAHIQERTGAGRVIDLYGFTEQLGIVYPDLGSGVRKIPQQSRLIVRDPYTLKPLPGGEVGLLQFLTPMPRSYPGISVLLDDLGRKHSSDTFEVIGRAKGSEVRGCGI